MKNIEREYPAKKRGKHRRVLPVLVVNLIVLGSLFLLAEHVYRRLRLRNTVVASASWYQYDSRLGWTPLPGKYLDENDEIFVTITPDGFRLTDPPGIDPNASVIMVGGCSNTFCEGVRDDETWPYHLSRELGVRVVNAGVSSYGYDQIGLRLLDEIDRVKPDYVIVAIIWQDIVFRSRLSYRRQHKPYFDIVNGRLELFNQPVPPPWVDPLSPRWYERSLLVGDLIHVVSARPGFVNEVVVHDRAMEVGRKLTVKIMEELRRRDIPWTLVILPTLPVPPELDRRHLRKISEMFGELETPMIDLWGVMKRDYPIPEDRENLFRGHYSPEGNRWVASSLTGILREHPEFNLKERDGD